MSDDKNPTQRPAVSLTEEQLKQAFDAGKQAAAEFKRMTLPPAKPGILDASKAYTDERVGVLKAEIDNLRDRVAMPERWIYEQEQRMEALAARVEELENRYSDLGRRHAKVVVRLEDIEEQIRGLASVQAGQGNNITAGSCSPDRDAVLPEPDDGREPAQSIAEPTPFDTQWDKHVDDLRQAQPPIAIEVGQVWRRKSGKTPPGSAVVEEVDSEGLVWMSGWGWFSPQGLVEDATLVEPAPKAEEPAEPVGWCPQCGPVTRVDEDGCCSGCGCDASGAGADQVLMQLSHCAEPKTEPLFPPHGEKKCASCGHVWAYDSIWCPQCNPHVSKLTSTKHWAANVPEPPSKKDLLDGAANLEAYTEHNVRGCNDVASWLRAVAAAMGGGK
jgi:hypothetical protein